MPVRLGFVACCFVAGLAVGCASGEKDGARDAGAAGAAAKLDGGHAGAGAMASDAAVLGDAAGGSGGGALVVDGVIDLASVECNEEKFGQAELRDHGVFDVYIDKAYTALVRVKIGAADLATVDVMTEVGSKQQMISWPWEDLYADPIAGTDYVFAQVLLVAPLLTRAIVPEVTAADGGMLEAKVTMRFASTSGQELARYEYPISVCSGCLFYVPPGVPVMTSPEGLEYCARDPEAPFPCINGQDEPVDCRALGMSVLR